MMGVQLCCGQGTGMEDLSYAGLISVLSVTNTHKHPAFTNCLTMAKENVDVGYM